MKKDEYTEYIVVSVPIDNPEWNARVKSINVHTTIEAAKRHKEIIDAMHAADGLHIRPLIIKRTVTCEEVE